MSDSRDLLLRHEKMIAAKHRQLQKGSVPDPAILVDARSDQVSIFAGDRSQAVQELAERFPDAAGILANDRTRRGTYPVLVITDTGVEHFHGETWGWRIYRASRERVEVEYLKARLKGIARPVIMLDSRNQEDRRRRVESEREMPEDWPMGHATLMIGSQARIASAVGQIRREVGEYVENGLPPELPLTVVVVQDYGIIEVFNDTEPEV